MIYSMTAFARLGSEKDWGDAVLGNSSSVNQRYLENFFRLPEQFLRIRKTRCVRNFVKAFTRE